MTTNDFIMFAVDSNLIIPDLETGLIYKGNNQFVSGNREKPYSMRLNPRGRRFIRVRSPITQKRHALYVHRIIAYAKFGVAVFNGNTHVDHKNGDRLDNRADNLQLLTPEENQAKPRKAAYRRFAVVSESGRTIATCMYEDDALLLASRHAGRVKKLERETK